MSLILAVLLGASITATSVAFSHFRVHGLQRAAPCIQLWSTKESSTQDFSDQFQQWAEEEISEAQAKQKAVLRDMKEEMAGEALPSYMIELMKQYGYEDELATPTPASKLPTMVIIGRPNTGKSTLVNRIAQTFKVITKYLLRCHFCHNLHKLSRMELLCTMSPV